jgi:hypothetical protein
MSIVLLSFPIKSHPTTASQPKQQGKDRIPRFCLLVFKVPLPRETFTIAHLQESLKFIILLLPNLFAKPPTLNPQPAFNKPNPTLASDIQQLMLRQQSQVLLNEWERWKKRHNIHRGKAKSNSNHISRFHKLLQPGFPSRKRRKIRN